MKKLTVKILPFSDIPLLKINVRFKYQHHRNWAPPETGASWEISKPPANFVYVYRETWGHILNASVGLKESNYFIQSCKQREGEASPPESVLGD